jgi:hypothetical protein
VTSDAIPKYVADFVIPAIGECLAELRRDCEVRVEALEARIGKLEEALAEFKYRGHWQEGKEYRAGNFVSHGGAIHHCNSDTSTKPGANGAWTLAVARGRDGKDAPEQRSPTMTRSQR